MKKEIKLSLASILTFSVVANAVPLFDGELSVGAVQHKPKGSLNYKGDTVDVKNDLGYDDETKFFAKLKLEHPVPLLPNIYLQYMPMDFEGDKITAFRFDNKLYVGKIHSEVKLDHYDIGLYYNLPMVSTLTAGMLDAELGVIVRVIDFEAKVSDGTKSSKADFTAPIPMLYGSVSVSPIDLITFVVEGKGIKYDESYYYDFSGEVRLTPLSAVVFKPFVAVGYRVERLRIDDVDDVYSDIRIKQPYISLGINF